MFKYQFILHQNSNNSACQIWTTIHFNTCQFLLFQSICPSIHLPPRTNQSLLLSLSLTALLAALHQ